MPSKFADRTDDERSDESFGLTESGDLTEHRLRDRDGFVWLSSAFVEVVVGLQSLRGIQHIFDAQEIGADRIKNRSIKFIFKHLMLTCLRGLSWTGGQFPIPHLQDKT